MACEITRPDPAVLFGRMRDMFSTTVLQGAPIIPESNEWYVVSLNYAVAEEFYAFTEQQWKERDPRTACCENLVKLAEQDGVFLRAATFAQGYVKITGAPGTALPDTIGVTIGGTTYTSVSVLPDVLPDDGEYTLRIRSEVVGQQSNGALPATGVLSPSIAGISNTVTVFGGFCGGEDAETCEQLRSRYLARKQFPTRATATWIEQKLAEWPCVTRVCSRACATSCATFTGGSADCNASLDYYVFMDNTFECGIPPQCVIDEIQNWMFGPEGQQGYGMGQVETGVCGRIYPTHAATINVTIGDYGCMSDTQKNEIRIRIAEFINTLCPSTELSPNQFNGIVGSVIGFKTNYFVEVSPAPGADLAKIGMIDCLDCGYELGCDAVACLGEIFFLDSIPDSGAC